MNQTAFIYLKPNPHTIMKSFNAKLLLISVISLGFLMQGCMLRGGSLLNRPTMNFPLSDAAPREGGFADIGTNYYSYENANILDAKIRGEYAFSDRLAFGAELGYRNINPDNDDIDSESGILDPKISGWFSPYNDDRTNIAVGGRVTLPAGDEEIGQGFTDYGAFVTARYLFTDQFVGVGQVGLDFYEPFFEDEDRESTFSVRGSLMYNVSRGADIFGEFYFQNDPEFAFRESLFDHIKGGANLYLGNGLDFRAAFGTGLGDEFEGPDYFGELKLALSF